jgi:Na+-transporting methylmalonyl-CoA/oxaloacetate decarboxylase gamma subunit
MSTKIVIVVGLIILMIVVSIVSIVIYFYMEEEEKSVDDTLSSKETAPVVKVDDTLSSKETAPVPVSCYGAKEGPCNTCTDVIDAYKAKGWSYKASNFAQCNQATPSP